MNFSFVNCSILSFLTHGYSVGVAVSYSWDFLICIKFCATMVIVLNLQPALRGQFVYKVFRSAMFTSNYGHWFSFVLLFKQSRVRFFDSF